ncbi:hypothetical protein EWM64_g5408 [Hericium alpestre]|uniref:Uncharacterized protein n=1 Tax=Hericium alpestre TaxID=135208 RepID=A0A4Y9ZX23_9AGAM|nr:hypothetical protein EWM64_g5408 [Hericium alpestre]
MKEKGVGQIYFLPIGEQGGEELSSHRAPDVIGLQIYRQNGLLIQTQADGMPLMIDPQYRTRETDDMLRGAKPHLFHFLDEQFPQHRCPDLDSPGPLLLSQHHWEILVKSYKQLQIQKPVAPAEPGLPPQEPTGRDLLAARFPKVGNGSKWHEQMIFLATRETFEPHEFQDWMREKASEHASHPDTVMKSIAEAEESVETEPETELEHGLKASHSDNGFTYLDFNTDMFSGLTSDSTASAMTSALTTDSFPLVEDGLDQFGTQHGWDQVGSNMFFDLPAPIPQEIGNNTGGSTLPCLTSSLQNLFEDILKNMPSDSGFGL